MHSQYYKQPYRILHCIDTLGRAGPGLQLLQTLRHIDRSKFQCLVCYFQPPCDLEKDILSLGIPVVNFNLRNQRNWLRAISGLRHLVNQYHIELIHGSTSSGITYAPLAGATMHIPVIFTINTSLDAKDYVAGNSSLKEWRVRWYMLLRALVLGATSTRLIAVSHSVKESAVQHLRINPGRIEVVYRGLVPENYNFEGLSPNSIINVKKQLGLDEAYPVLINVANLLPSKGQKLLLEAMPHILRSLPNARLLIAGEGPLRDELEKTRDILGLKRYVQFLGRRNDIPALLSAAHIFLFSSYYEGLPNAVLEAMAVGRPIVAFDIPMLREVVGEEDAGVLVAGREPTRLAEKVVELASNPGKAQTLGQRGQQVVRQKFDIRCNVRQLEAMYERALSAS